MSLTDLPVLDMLKAKMKWHQTRQGVLAENIANADTPSYGAREISKFTFERAMKLNVPTNLTTKMTSSAHIASAPIAGTEAPGVSTEGSWEVTPSGNSVSLEDQMMKVTQNQMDYQAASSLYSRALGLIRIALDGGR